MKTAISIPDALFRDADQLAARLGWSRSQLYANAVREFIAQYDDDPVTAALNAFVDEGVAEAVPNAGRALIDSGEWEW